MRGANQVDAFRGDAEGGRDHGYAHHRGRDRVRLAMPVGMILIRRLDGQPQPVVDDRRTDDIQERFDSVGQQGKGMPNQPGQAFDQRQRQVDDDAEQGGAQAAFHHLFGCRRGRHGCIVSYSQRAARR